MRVITSNENQFKPIHLTIRIESENELRLLISLFSANITVPNMLLKENYFNKEVDRRELSTMMLLIHSRIV